MKILVGLSGASGVELGFYLLKALEKHANSNDEIFAILSKGAKMSFWAENLVLQESVRKSKPQNLASQKGKGEFAREFDDENSATRHCEHCESKAWQSTNLQNKGAKSTNSPLQKSECEFDDDFIAFCKEKFALNKTQFLDDENLAASVASGSFGVSQTIIAPCSLNTLAKIKQGIADTLITRSAAVALKERKRLILCVREMPFSTLALKQMTKLSKMGVIIAPPVYAGYAGARNLEDLRNFIIGKWLDLLEIKHSLYKKWGDIA